MLTELDVLGIVGDRLTACEIPFMLTGSFAMAHYTTPRMTRDIDLVVQFLDAVAGRTDWPHNVFSLYWPRANSQSFAPNDVTGSSGTVDVDGIMHEFAA